MASRKARPTQPTEAEIEKHEQAGHATQRLSQVLCVPFLKTLFHALLQ